MNRRGRPQQRSGGQSSGGRGSGSQGSGGRGSGGRGSGGRAGQGSRPSGPQRRPKPRRAIKVTPIADAPPSVLEQDVRLNKYLASAGICSRRKADEMIEAGRVSVNGEIVVELGTRIDPSNDDVRVDDSRVQPEKSVYLLFNKPRGVVCTNAANEQRRRAIDFMPKVRGRVYTVGRLDAASEGLILLTNDGEFAQHITHPRHGVPKTYAILVRGRVTPEDADKARGGVWLSDGKTSGAKVMIDRRSRDRTYLKVVLREGRNRELRRVFAKLGYPVISLKRVRIGDLNLHGLGAGKYRFLQREEVQGLLTQTQSAGSGDD